MQGFRTLKVWVMTFLFHACHVVNGIACRMYGQGGRSVPFSIPLRLLLPLSKHELYVRTTRTLERAVGASLLSPTCFRHEENEWHFAFRHVLYFADNNKKPQPPPVDSAERPLPGWKTSEPAKVVQQTLQGWDFTWHELRG